MGAVFASYTSDIALIITIYRELKKLNSLTNNGPVKKWANEQNRAFSKEEIHMVKTHMKKCSTYQAIKETKTKNILRFHLTSVRMATIMNTNDTKHW
jgi:hypothetical protein